VNLGRSSTRAIPSSRWRRSIRCMSTSRCRSKTSPTWPGFGGARHHGCGSRQTFEGKVNAINPDVDFATRSCGSRRRCPTPGKAAPRNVRQRRGRADGAEKSARHSATAVLYAPYGDSVFVIDEKKDATPARCRKSCASSSSARPRSGDFVTITSNLNPATPSSPRRLQAASRPPVEVDNKLARTRRRAQPDNT